MNFMGTVYRRSTSGSPQHANVAGEAEVFECNPQRVRRIMDETGWKSVFYGTLNLEVADGVFDCLSDMRELFFEQPQEVKHPTDPSIPERRKGYYYYRAEISVRGVTQEVLVRRAGNPHNQKCLETIAPVKLRDHFRIDEGDEVEVRLI